MLKEQRKDGTRMYTELTTARVGWRLCSCDAYLICDQGYLHWPYLKTRTLHHQKMILFIVTQEHEKNVKYLFGILKKQRKVLEYGMYFWDIRPCNKVESTESVLNMLSSWLGMQRGIQWRLLGIFEVVGSNISILLY
jgi:hypothetical protein